MLYDNHKGWLISYNELRPVTGRWKAEKQGVSMCAGTREALVNMIDARSQDKSLNAR